MENLFIQIVIILCVEIDKYFNFHGAIEARRLVCMMQCQERVQWLSCFFKGGWEFAGGGEDSRICRQRRQDCWYKAFVNCHDILKDVKYLWLKELGNFIKHVASTRPGKLDKAVKLKLKKVSEIFLKSHMIIFSIRTPSSTITLIMKEVGGEISNVFLSRSLVLFAGLWFTIVQQSALNIQST